MLAEGYYAKTYNGEFVTYINNEFKKLDRSELKNYRQFRIYKKYNFTKKLDEKTIDNIIKDMY